MFKIPIILLIVWVLFSLLANDKKPANYIIGGLLALATAVTWLLALFALLWRIP